MGWGCTGAKTTPCLQEACILVEETDDKQAKNINNTMMLGAVREETGGCRRVRERVQGSYYEEVMVKL